jgi:hypothetical protein
MAQTLFKLRFTERLAALASVAVAHVRFQVPQHDH